MYVCMYVGGRDSFIRRQLFKVPRPAPNPLGVVAGKGKKVFSLSYCAYIHTYMHTHITRNVIHCMYPLSFSMISKAASCKKRKSGSRRPRVIPPKLSRFIECMYVLHVCMYVCVADHLYLVSAHLSIYSYNNIILFFIYHMINIHTYILTYIHTYMCAVRVDKS